MRILKWAALILFVGVLLVVVLFFQSLSARNGESTAKVDYVITAGKKTADIAQELENQGIIRNGFAFYVYMKLIGAKILPGTYELSSADSATKIGWSLGSGKFKTAKITIIEGWRASQIGQYLVEEKKLKNVSDFADKAAAYEGYLFPDTYEVKADIASDELIKLLRETFEEKTSDLNLTPETVILASIVERESKSDTDRPLVAGVYSNRIKQGMRLEADPTVQYAKGSWAAITLDDYRSTISPYNTYLNDGWPPGPICSPGLKSLQAAAAPAQHEYLFFFHAKGETHFSKTHSEHRAKVAEYF